MSGLSNIRFFPLICWPRRFVSKLWYCHGISLNRHWAPMLLTHVLCLPVEANKGKTYNPHSHQYSIIKFPLFLSLCRFSMPTLIPQRWFSIGSHSRSWPALYELDLRCGRTALHSGSSFMAVRLQVRQMKCILLYNFSDFFWPTSSWDSLL